MYKLVHDWFSPNISNLTTIFNGYASNTPPDILEIGSLEGRSTLWFLECVRDCTVTTIDTWEGGADHDPNNPEIDFEEIEQNFKHNMSYFGSRVTAIKNTSYNALVDLIATGKRFDFVFIDGSHTAVDVNLDLVLSFKLLKVGGILYADDYLWGFSDRSIYDSPKLGIDSFVNVYANKITPFRGLDNHAAIYLKVSE